MCNIKLAITDPEYKQWISNIEKRFREQQIKAAVQVNSSKIEFYWSLGRDICEMHVEERWGESVIKQLSEDLRLATDEAKGLTPGNLYYCKRFYLLYNQLFEKVPQVGEIFHDRQEKGIISAEKQIVPQVGEIFKPLHPLPENDGSMPLNIFAIPSKRRNRPSDNRPSHLSQQEQRLCSVLLRRLQPTHSNHGIRRHPDSARELQRHIAKH